MSRLPISLISVFCLLLGAACGSSVGDSSGPNLLLDTAPDVGEVAEGDAGAEDVPAKDWSDTLTFDLEEDGLGACDGETRAFGCPCDANDDCASGFCVPGPVGDVCTQECLEECPDGWDCKGVAGFGPDLVFLCVPPPSTLCAACGGDEDCEGGVCVTIDTGSYCLPTCDVTCPETFECGVGLHEGAEIDACIPVSGACECSAESDGEIRPCWNINEFGTCEGFEICDAGSGWVDCTAPLPAPELCDAQDNDCDGDIDEGFTDEAGGYTLDAHCGFCNNDCVDAVPHGTGTCDGELDVPKCVVEECDPGYIQVGVQCIPPQGDPFCQPCVTDADCADGPCVDIDGDARCLPGCGNGEACPAGTDCDTFDGFGELCVPVTGSCTCGEATKGTKRPCTTVGDLGACAGFQVCQWPDGWAACDAPAPAPEICNGVDDDCDGLVDDGIGIGAPCEKSNVYGTCAGAEICIGYLGLICQGPTPGPEVCNLVDDDCDGAVDEDFKDGGGLYAFVAHCGTCTTSCVGLFPHGTAACDTSSGIPKCVIEECEDGYFNLDGTQCIPFSYGLCLACDEDGDCPVPGASCVDFAGEGGCATPCGGALACPEGYVCEDTGGLDLCVPANGSCSCGPATLGLSAGCQLTWPPAVPVDQADAVCPGAKTCGPTGWEACSVGDELCDGQDNDCDGEIDEGFTVGGAYLLDAHCGQCGNDCSQVTGENVVGVCDSSGGGPACVVACAEGFTDQNGNLADGCECQVGDAADVPDGEDQNCDGIDGEIDNAIFVAVWGDDGAAGSILSPVAGIQVGITKALAAGKRDVYVAAGLYPGSVTLVPGAHVYGGFSNDFKSYQPALYDSRIVGGPATEMSPGALNAFDIDGPPDTVIFDGMTVQGVDAEAASASTYAVYLSGCTDAVRLSDNRFIGGTGGPGVAGASGPSGAPGGDGAAGASPVDTGTKNCDPAQEAPGGAGGVGSCGGVDISGGLGGAGLCPVFEDEPQPLEAGAPGAGADAGAGGAAGWDTKVHHASCKMCILPSGDIFLEGLDGAPGGPGLSGQGGVGCSGTGGEVVGDLWVPGVAAAGGTAGAGSGGGGGGAGGGVDSDANKCSDIVSATGGGGGAGGCGGDGGLGGANGGASFSIFVVGGAEATSAPVLVDNLIEAGPGGPGGGGGNGGSGGPGGGGGPGGAFSGLDLWCVYGGGHGGAGGGGGHGGGGGGGCGGPSYGIYAHGFGGVDLSAWKEQGNTFVLGAGGTGGGGGLSLGGPGQPGAPGAATLTNF
jgi:hypothetical protein